MAYFRYRCLFEGALLTTSATVLYTAPANTRTLLGKLTLTNISGSSASVTIYIVPRGGTPGTSNEIWKTLTIPAGGNNTECRDVTEIVNHVLEAGDSLQALASANSAITARLSGAETIFNQ